jgi:hypothetical protein
MSLKWSAQMVFMALPLFYTGYVFLVPYRGSASQAQSIQDLLVKAREKEHQNKQQQQQQVKDPGMEVEKKE